MSDGALDDEHGLVTACDALLERAAAAGADEVQVHAAWAEERKVGFERNELSLASASEEAVVTLTVHAGGRLGSAQTNSLADEDLERAVAAALEVSRFAPPDEHLNLPRPADLPRPLEPSDLRWDPALVDFPAERVQGLATDFLRALRADPRVSVDGGEVAWERGEVWICNGHGIRAHDRWTELSWTGSGQGIDGDQVTSFDWAEGLAYGLAGAAERMRADAAAFVEGVCASFGAGASRSYKGRVLLTPRAVASLLVDPLLYHLSGLQVAYGKSAYPDDRVGEAIAGSWLTLEDDPEDVVLEGAGPFDDEGVPTSRMCFVDQGVLRRHMESAYSARWRGRPLTGHAGFDLHAPTVRAGRDDAGALREALTEGGAGLELHRFSGNVDPTSGDFSGVAKGSHLVGADGGRTPVTETMVAGNLFEMLQAAVAVEDRTHVVDGRLRAPAIVVDGLSVTAAG